MGQATTALQHGKHFSFFISIGQALLYADGDSSSDGCSSHVHAMAGVDDAAVVVGNDVITDPRYC